MNSKGEEKEVKHEIRFVDSFKFMGFSLSHLVANLEKDQLVETKKSFGEKVDLLSRKGVYPYDWMESFEKFNEVLPGKEAFFSKLNGEGITDEDYQHNMHAEFGKNLE